MPNNVLKWRTGITPDGDIRVPSRGTKPRNALPATISVTDKTPSTAQVAAPIAQPSIRGKLLSWLIP